jgi:hypothetical protein
MEMEFQKRRIQATEPLLDQLALILHLDQLQLLDQGLIQAIEKPMQSLPQLNNVVPLPTFPEGQK